jgi:hypothetical protein
MLAAGRVAQYHPAVPPLVVPAYWTRRIAFASDQCFSSP